MLAQSEFSLFFKYLLGFYKSPDKVQTMRLNGIKFQISPLLPNRLKCNCQHLFRQSLFQILADFGPFFRSRNLSIARDLLYHTESERSYCKPFLDISYKMRLKNCYPILVLHALGTSDSKSCRRSTVMPTFFRHFCSPCFVAQI